MALSCSGSLFRLSVWRVSNKHQLMDQVQCPQHFSGFFKVNTVHPPILPLSGLGKKDGIGEKGGKGSHTDI